MHIFFYPALNARPAARDAPEMCPGKRLEFSIFDPQGQKNGPATHKASHLQSLARKSTFGSTLKHSPQKSTGARLSGCASASPCTKRPWVVVTSQGSRRLKICGHPTVTGTRLIQVPTTGQCTLTVLKLHAPQIYHKRREINSQIGLRLKEVTKVRVGRFFAASTTETSSALQGLSHLDPQAWSRFFSPGSKQTLSGKSVILSKTDARVKVFPPLAIPNVDNIGQSVPGRLARPKIEDFLSNIFILKAMLR